MGKTVKNRVGELLEIRKRRTGQLPSRREIAEITGLSTATIQTWVDNRTTRFDAPVIEAWCNFLGVGIGELLIMEETEDSETKTPLAAAV